MNPVPPAVLDDGHGMPEQRDLPEVPPAAGKKPLPKRKAPVRTGAQNARMVENPIDNPRAIVNEQRKAANQASITFNEKLSRLPEGRVIASAISTYNTGEAKEFLTIRNVRMNGMNDAEQGVIDPMLGPWDANTVCSHCSQIDCPGHYGIVPFNGRNGTLIIHPLFYTFVPKILKVFCWSCASLIPPVALLQQRGILGLSAGRRLDAIIDEFEPMQCLRNKDLIKPNGDLVPLCEMNPELVTTELKEQGILLYLVSGGKKGETKVTEQMPISRIYDIFSRISEADAKIVGFTEGSHPLNLLQQGQIVNPRAARPCEQVRGRCVHDSQTVSFDKVARTAQPIPPDAASLYRASRDVCIDPPAKKGSAKQNNAIGSRIQGRDAVIRRGIQGKRNDKSARGVAGPGPELLLDQTGMPRRWMGNITKSQRVTDINYLQVQEWLRNGLIRRYKGSNGMLISVNQDRIPEIKVGDIVWRYLRDGDLTMMNRQPTLHKVSLMGYEIQGHDGNVSRSHLSTTTPGNKDFDGDEENAWVTQEPSAEAEVKYIVSAKQNIMSQENNRPAMACVMNTITGSYILSGYGDKRAGDEILYEELKDILRMEVGGNSGFGRQLESLPARLNKYGIHPLSGYGIFSMLFPETFHYERKGVKVIEGVLIRGRVTKEHVGVVSRSMVQDLHKKFGAEEAYRFLCNAPRIIGKWLMETGFSVSITDFLRRNGDDYDLTTNQEILDKELAQIYVKIDALGEQKKDPIAEAERERSLARLLNKTAAIGMRLAKDVLKPDNQLAIMTDQGAGTKGSAANIGQMQGAVGQQYYHGERLKATITDGKRSLPAFYVGENTPESRAFIPQSFFRGLTPTGLFFLQWGGREGILDTSLKTAETGTMQRNMTKSFENILIANDGTVRNTTGALFSTVYGACGYSVGEQLNVDKTGKRPTISFIDLSDTATELNVKHGWIPASINQQIVARRGAEGYQEQFVEPDSNNLKLVNPQRLTHYEKSRVIGARAMQIWNNAPPIIDPEGETNDLKIAEREYATGKLDICVIRQYPDGHVEKIYPTLENI